MGIAVFWWRVFIGILLGIVGTGIFMVWDIIGEAYEAKAHLPNGHFLSFLTLFVVPFVFYTLGYIAERIEARTRRDTTEPFFPFSQRRNVPPDQ